MSSKCITAGIYIFLVMFFPSNGEAAERVFDPVTGGKWYYAIGESEDTYQDAEVKQYTQLDNLSGLHLKHPEREGYLWIKTSFETPDRLKGKLCALLLGRIIIADMTYLNGVLIGKTGKFPPGFFSEWNTTRYYQVPYNVLEKNGSNELYIKLYVNHEGSITGKKMLDRAGLVHDVYVKQDFMNSRINALIAFLMFMIACYHIIIYTFRTKDRENIYYALACFIFAFYLTNFFITRLPFFDYSGISYLFYQKLVMISMFIIAYFLVRFLQLYLGTNYNKKVQYVLGIATIIPSLILLFLPYYALFMKVRFIVIMFLLVHVGYVIYITIQAAMKKQVEARVIFIGSIPLYICILFDIIVHNLLQLNDYIYLTGLGFPSFLVAIAGILASRFVQYHNEVEELNISLEQKVEDRTSELQNANESLRKTMDELKEAQEIAERDMRMAINMQQSMLPETQFTTTDWQTAVYFQPMTGVSGDFYDFYFENGRLKGAGLFDVSGHGISSGIITIMAKSIIYRHFCELTHENPGKVLEAVNQDLIQELENIDNYLTGILLQFDGGVVEYTNAAHTDLLLKRVSSNHVRKVNVKDSDFRGMFLGIPDMQHKYATLKFSVKTGDMLLLYSDCLIEQKNIDKEEYGIERLIQAFQAAPKHIPRDMLDYILNDFNAFRGDEPFDDDLTIMALKKVF